MTTATAGPTLTEALVAFTTGGWAMRTPIRDAGRGLVAATLARALRGENGAAAEAALAAAEAGTTHLRARLIGRARSVGALDAALVNGIAAAAAGSFTAPVVCAAFAAGDGAQAAGAVVLDAIVVGSEIAVRLAAGLGPARGWDLAGTAGRLGAAAAVARVFGLNAERTRNALGIAATEAGGLRSAVGTPTAAYVQGLAAADGVEAALLARFGFTGAPQAIEGRRGLAALMSTAFDPQAVLAGLGERYRFVELAEVAAGPAARAALASTLGAQLARLEKLPTLAELPL